jgi:hypothetical protein
MVLREFTSSAPRPVVATRSALGIIAAVVDGHLASHQVAGMSIRKLVSGMQIYHVYTKPYIEFRPELRRTTEEFDS